MNVWRMMNELTPNFHELKRTHAAGVSFELVLSLLLSFSLKILRFCSLLAAWGSDQRREVL